MCIRLRLCVYGAQNEPDLGNWKGSKFSRAKRGEEGYKRTPGELELLCLISSCISNFLQVNAVH